MLLVNIRHDWPETFGARAKRYCRKSETVVLHFHDAVRLSVGARIFSVPAGTFIAIAPGTEYAYEREGGCVLDWMFLAGSVTDLVRMYGLEMNVPYQVFKRAEITGIMEMMEFEFYIKHSWWYRYVDIKFEEMLILISLGLQHTRQTAVGMSMTHRFKALRLEMIAYPERDWSVCNIANRIGISESRVFPLYKSLFGISPNRDLILMRVEKAKRLLESGMSVAEVSEAAGYMNVCHFIRQFRAQTGLTPHQYYITNGTRRT